MKRTGPTNKGMQELIIMLRKLGHERHAPLWQAVAQELSRSTRARREVNLTKLDRVTKENEVVLIPGKVLGSGDLTHKLTVIAFAASQSAREKIKQSGGTYTKIIDALQRNPEGGNMRIIG